MKGTSELSLSIGPERRRFVPSGPEHEGTVVVREGGTRNTKHTAVFLHGVGQSSGFFMRGVSKKFGEWYQKTNKTEDTNKLTLLVFKILAILHNTLLATFIKLLETVSKGRQAPDQENTVDGLLFPRLKSIMKGARF
jgi:hypothetical protein